MREQDIKFLAAVEQAIDAGIQVTNGYLGSAPPASAELATRAYAFLNAKLGTRSQPEQAQNSAYANLCKIFESVCFLDESDGIITWLQQTNVLGDASKPAITNSTAALKVAINLTLQNPQVSAWLAEAEHEVPASDDVKRRNLKLMKYMYQRTTALDADFTRRYSEAGSHCEDMWMEARAKNDFAIVLPALKTLIEFEREKKPDISPST